MVTQPAYIKNLKNFSRDQNPPQDKVALVDSIMKESDRGAVILSATQVEDALEWAITALLVGLRKDPRLRDKVFGQSGLAPSFSAKADLALAMDLIDAQIHAEITLIREMRNACAHARQALHFHTPELRAASDKLFGDEIFSGPQEPIAYRFGFVLKCAQIQQRIYFQDTRSAAEMLEEMRQAVSKARAE